MLLVVAACLVPAGVASYLVWSRSGGSIVPGEQPPATPPQPAAPDAPAAAAPSPPGSARVQSETVPRPEPVESATTKTLPPPVPESSPLLRRLKGHGSLVNWVAISSDGKLAASAGGAGGPGSDNSVRVWDLASGAELCRLQGHTDRVFCVAFSPDGSQAVSGSADRTVRLWDVPAGKERHRLEGHTGSVLAVAFSPDGKQVLSAGGFSPGYSAEDYTIRTWDADTGREIQERTPQAKGFSVFLSQVAFAPDGRQALVNLGGTAELGRSIWVYDLESDAVLRTLTGHTKLVRSFALSPDGAHAVSCGYRERFLYYWDVRAGKLVNRFQGPVEDPVCVAISPDGKRALSDHADGTICLWDLETGRELLRRRADTRHPDRARHNIVFSPDGRQALSVSRDEVLLWDVAVK